ncbi:3018_t:CDS:2, partial [Funneliformis mosseae]
MENGMIPNIDDYHSIHTKRMPNTIIISTAIRLATILMNPITTQYAIPKMNIHNPILVDAELIKTNMKNKFMRLCGLLHNQCWGFYIVDDDIRLEELTMHKNGLHSLDVYIKAINIVVDVLSIQQYIQQGNIISIVADWPEQIYLRIAISRYL